MIATLLKKLVYVPPDKLKAIRREGGFTTLNAWITFFAIIIILGGISLIMLRHVWSGLLLLAIAFVPIAFILVVIARRQRRHSSKGTTKELEAERTRPHLKE